MVRLGLTTSVTTTTWLVWLLLAASWTLLANSLTLEEFDIKEKNVMLLAEDALLLATDTVDCGKLHVAILRLFKGLI